MNIEEKCSKGNRCVGGFARLFEGKNKRNGLTNAMGGRS
jgi:hypothetical protein